jgi:hypothetical protein
VAGGRVNGAVTGGGGNTGAFVSIDFGTTGVTSSSGQSRTTWVGCRVLNTISSPVITGLFSGISSKDPPNTGLTGACVGRLTGVLDGLGVTGALVAFVGLRVVNFGTTTGDPVG